MHRLIPTFIAFIVMTFSSLSFAGEVSGPYIGLSVGSSSLDSTLDTLSGETDFDASDTAYKLFAGYNFGWIPLLDLAVEGGYVDFGEPSDGVGAFDVESEASAWTAFGLVGGNFGPVGVFGKVGLAAWDSEILIDELGDGGFSDDGSDFAYGIGAKFQLVSLAFRAEYEMFDIEDADVDMFSVGVAWTF